MTHPAGFDAICDRPCTTHRYPRNVFLIPPLAGTLARNDQFRSLTLGAPDLSMDIIAAQAPLAGTFE